MGKKKSESKKKQQASAEPLYETLGDFTSKDNWDKFFTIRGADEAFEWYAEWPQLRDPLFSHLPSLSSDPPQILVPACGNSRLSEHLYDSGFLAITNIDFSKVVISDMLRRNVRDRPGMRWRVMDITSMQFMDDTFDAVLDKGGLDALMEPKLGPKLGIGYLSEVKRVLKSGGKFICLTLAESYVLDVLFSMFRFGWKIGVHAIPLQKSSQSNHRTFMVVAEKDISTVLHQITSSFNLSSFNCNAKQASGLREALENENRIRIEYSDGSDVRCSLEDLQLGAKGDLMKLSPARRFELTLGGQMGSRFRFKAVLLDAQQQSGSFSYHCGVFIVPKTRAHEWLFSSEEGQWMVVESSKTARLIMVLLDSSHSNASMEDIQTDLSPLVKQLAPGKDDNGAQIPFMMAGDGIKQRNTVHQVTSPLTGEITVEDVVYENVDADLSHLSSSRDLTFRRLVFQRAEGLVQSEALLVGETERKKTNSLSKSKKSGNHKQIDESSNEPKVYHGYLASSYHMGIVSGYMLISSYLESMSSSGKEVKAVVIGLGAGLLPMFLHECMPFMHIEVVELDPVMHTLAREYFGFIEDKHLQVHIADGIQFVRKVSNLPAANGASLANGNGDALFKAKPPSPSESSTTSHADVQETSRVDILIIDVDSSDSSSGMTCPAPDFVEESFLRTVKDSISEQGLFIINLVSRSEAVKDMVVSRLKAVFSHLFSLQLEEDVNLVLFAIPSEFYTKEDKFPDAAVQLEKLLKSRHPEMCQSIIESTKKIRCLK